MKIVVSALFEEIATMFTQENLQKIQNDRFELYKSTFNGKEILVGCCGIGKVNAASFTQFIIDHFILEEIIVIGAAGALNQELNIGDVVVAKDFIYGDVDVRAFGYHFGQMAQMPHTYLAKKVSLKIFEFLDFKTQHGTIVSVDKFLSKYDANFDLLQTKDAVDMETCAIAQVAYKNKIEISAFRAISDNSFCSKNAASDYEQTKHIVADNLYKVLKLYI